MCIAQGVNSKVIIHQLSDAQKLFGGLRKKPQAVFGTLAAGGDRENPLGRPLKHNCKTQKSVISTHLSSMSAYAQL